MDAPPSEASHNVPDPTWGYRYLWADAHPNCDVTPGSRCHDKTISYRVCGMSLSTTPADGVYNDWIDKFRQRLTQLGAPASWLISKLIVDCGTDYQDLRLTGTTQKSQILEFCRAQVVACIAPDWTIFLSDRGYWATIRAVTLFDTGILDTYSVGRRQHVVAHEMGHMMGLAHHSDCTVMGPATCTSLASAADVATGVCDHKWWC